jgi:hypothetical protein
MATTTGKGNPASHRMSNAAYKDRRARSWIRGQRRRAERREQQEARHAANQERRKNGQPTPWQIVKQKRFEARHG